MKKLVLFITLAAPWICSCDDDSKPAVQDQLVGNWEYTMAQAGSSIMMSPLSGPEKYDFRKDMTFVKKHSPVALYDWRDEGTWIYSENTKTLTLTYKIYTQQVSDTMTTTLVIESITDKKLVLKTEFNDTDPSGKFVEFKYIHYKRK